MNNRLLIYLSLASSVIGLVIVYIAANNVQLPAVLIGKIVYDDIGKNVKVCGEVDSLSVSKSKHTFFDIVDSSGRINVVVFNSSAEKLQPYSLKDDDTICVSGQVGEYNDRLEILPKEISR